MKQFGWDRWNCPVGGPAYLFELLIVSRAVPCLLALGALGISCTQRLTRQPLLGTSPQDAAAQSNVCLRTVSATPPPPPRLASALVPLALCAPNIAVLADCDQHSERVMANTATSRPSTPRCSRRHRRKRLLPSSRLPGGRLHPGFSPAPLHCTPDPCLFTPPPPPFHATHILGCGCRPIAV